VSTTRSIHFKRAVDPPSVTAEDEHERLASADRLSLFLEALSDLRHCNELMRDVQRGKADLETSIVVLDRAAVRFAAAIHALVEGP
jgi:hypothetical protein